MPHLPQLLEMQKFGRWGSYVACATSGVLMVVSFAPFNWWPCSWIALIPAWLNLRTDASIQRHPLRHGYLLGSIFIGGCFWWVSAVTPLGFAVMLIVLSIYPAIWFVLLTCFFSDLTSTRIPAARSIFLWAFAASSFWVTLEWFRTWFLSGFNWNELGVSQSPALHIRQLVAVGGVPLLSFVVVSFNVLAAEFVLSLRAGGKTGMLRASLPFLAGIGILTATWIYGSQHIKNYRDERGLRSISYSCIQPNIPEIPYTTAAMSEIAPREVDAFRVEEQMSYKATENQPDLLLWPEAITTQRLLLDPLIGTTVRNVMENYGGDFLLGAEELDQGKVYNCAYLLNPHTKSVQVYRKIYLVVLGEYLPWSERWPWLGKYWGGATSLHSGTQPACFMTNHDGIRLSPLICFEDTQPQAVQNAAALNPDFFVTLTNDSWYTGLPAIWMQTQHLQNALLRCVEHDRSLLRCANSGISCEIDPNGTILARLTDSKGQYVGIQGTLSGRLLFHSPHPTLYERWGNWVGLLSRLATAVFGIVFLRTKLSEVRLSI